MTLSFPIHNRFTGAVQFTAEIFCLEAVPLGVKRGLAVRWAVATRAVLTGADLTGAVLTGAVLTGADLTGADLTRAVLTRAILPYPDIPVVPDIDAAILASIASHAAAGTNGLRMRSWHGVDCDETNWCQTTHCRAGYAICLAGAAGFALERKCGAAAAGALIYAASRPGKPVPNFFASDADAMEDMRGSVADQS